MPYKNQQTEKEIVSIYLINPNIAEINRRFGTCHATVRRILKKHNLYMPVEKPKPINIDEVQQLYNQGLSGKTIAQKIGSKYTTFVNWCRDNGFDLTKERKYPPRPHDDVNKFLELDKTEFWKNIDITGLKLRAYAKYFIDDNLFENIDNEYKAYILGYMYADGNSHDGAFQATSTDLDILEKMKYCLKFSGKIRIARTHENGNIYYNLYCRCSKICYDLNEKGCPERKSLILKFPDESILPKHLTHHFIRGYFDGDGSIFVSRIKGWDEWAMAFVGTREFMEGVAKHLSFPVRYTQTREGRNNWTITFCKLEYLKQAINYMYKDATLAMTRKAKLADECLQYIYEHQLYKGKI